MNKAAQALGRLGGKAGTGASKARTSEQAREAVKARWAKVKRPHSRNARPGVRKGETVAPEGRKDNESSSATAATKRPD
jgi:hypothetical protein